MAQKPSRRKSPPKPAAKHSPAGMMVSISGIRGIAGDGFTADSIMPFVRAFAELCGGQRIVVGHDARPSSRWVVPFVESVLRSLGIDVVAVGLAPTPTIGLLVRKLKAAGGIAVTASHNPIEYNGLKFFSSAGEFITQEMLTKILAIIARPSRRTTSRIGKRAQLTTGPEIHLSALMNALPPLERVKLNKRPAVIIDCCNSAGAEIAPHVADAYGAVFQLMHSDVTKYEFPRGPEPTEKNIAGLRRAVVREGADIGFALDPDADRLAIVDEFGHAIGEERTLLLAADAFLTITKKKSPLVVNLSSSRAMDDLAKAHGVHLFRTAIGEANVLAGMRKHKARIGGEGNGGVIVPAVQPGRDAATGIALILMGLQSRGGTLSQWNARFPSYAMVKESAPVGKISVAIAMKKFKAAFKKAKFDSTDGLKATLGDRWVHLRPSNTEPVMRIFAEAPTEAEAQELAATAVALFQ
ncbi:phosphoglucosamine mutase [soil metagenome]